MPRLAVASKPSRTLPIGSVPVPAADWVSLQAHQGGMPMSPHTNHQQLSFGVANARSNAQTRMKWVSLHMLSRHGLVHAHYARVSMVGTMYHPLPLLLVASMTVNCLRPAVVTQLHRTRMPARHSLGGMWPLPLAAQPVSSRCLLLMTDVLM